MNTNNNEPTQDEMLDEITKRFNDGFNIDATTPHHALTYRADVGYLLGKLSEAVKCQP